ncbi:MAG TPA: hypothetical protein PLO37_11415 [Candidatus Hydrogenedentes bacterium]|nr:hypothetical protein [Candidatus Hydrogenedentota bacterium]HPG67448.1 hypothetical protein [Candidatus Hydrogenedentota bacterium]
MKTRARMRGAAMAMGLLAVLGVVAPVAAEPAPAFAFVDAFSEMIALDADGQRLHGVSLMPKRLARVDHYGRLIVTEGYFALDEVADGLAAAFAKARGLTLEAVIEPEAADGVESVVLGLGGDEANLRLVQSNAALRLEVRTAKGTQSVTVGEIPTRQATHVMVTCAGDGTACYFNGERIRQGEGVECDFSGWKPQPIAIGSAVAGRGWCGIIEHVALYPAALDGAECAGCAQAYRERVAQRAAVPRLKVRARLTARSTPPTLDELAPYTQALAVYAYKVTEVVEGSYDGATLYVAHWCILDRTDLPFRDAPLDTEYVLALEPFEANPQLESENLSDEVVEDFSIPLFYDAGGLSAGFTERDCR